MFNSANVHGSSLLQKADLGDFFRIGKLSGISKDSYPWKSGTFSKCWTHIGENAVRPCADSLASYGNAKTSIALPDFGCRISGANSAGISVDQLPPPVPAGMAMYCFPFARYVIGNPCAEVIRRVCQRIFPVVASYAYM